MSFFGTSWAFLSTFFLPLLFLLLFRVMYMIYTRVRFEQEAEVAAAAAATDDYWSGLENEWELIVQSNRFNGRLHGTSPSRREEKPEVPYRRDTRRSLVAVDSI